MGSVCKGTDLIIPTVCHGDEPGEFFYHLSIYKNKATLTGPGWGWSLLESSVVLCTICYRIYTYCTVCDI